MKITDKMRMDWLIKNLWRSKERLLVDAYFENKSLRKSIAQEIRCDAEKKKGRGK